MVNYYTFRVKSYNGCVTLCVVKLILGAQYTLYGRPLRLIKTTKTGYNLLNEKTNKCVLRTMYPTNDKNKILSKIKPSDRNLRKNELFFTLCATLVKNLREHD